MNINKGIKMLLSKLIKCKTKKPSNEISRTVIINYLINKYTYKTYLEIGVRDPKTNFDKIKIICLHLYYHCLYRIHYP